MDTLIDNYIDYIKNDDVDILTSVEFYKHNIILYDKIIEFEPKRCTKKIINELIIYCYAYNLTDKFNNLINKLLFEYNDFDSYNIFINKLIGMLLCEDIIYPNFIDKIEQSRKYNYDYNELRLHQKFTDEYKQYTIKTIDYLIDLEYQYLITDITHKYINIFNKNINIYDVLLYYIKYDDVNLLNILDKYINIIDYYNHSNVNNIHNPFIKLIKFYINNKNIVFLNFIQTNKYFKQTLNKMLIDNEYEEYFYECLSLYGNLSLADSHLLLSCSSKFDIILNKIPKPNYGDINEMLTCEGIIYDIINKLGSTKLCIATFNDGISNITDINIDYYMKDIDDITNRIIKIYEYFDFISHRANRYKDFVNRVGEPINHIKSVYNKHASKEIIITNLEILLFNYVVRSGNIDLINKVNKYCSNLITTGFNIFFQIAINLNNLGVLKYLNENISDHPIYTTIKYELDKSFISGNKGRICFSDVAPTYIRYNEFVFVGYYKSTNIPISTKLYLNRAFYNNNLDIIKYLIKTLNIDYDKIHAVKVAAYNNNIDIIKYIYKKFPPSELNDVAVYLTTSSNIKKFLLTSFYNKKLKTIEEQVSLSFDIFNCLSNKIILEEHLLYSFPDDISDMVNGYFKLISDKTYYDFSLSIVKNTSLDEDESNNDDKFDAYITSLTT